MLLLFWLEVKTHPSILIKMICYDREIFIENINLFSTKSSTSDNNLRSDEHPDQPLEYLVQSQTRPQAQVGPEEVKGVHEAELVQGGLPYPDLVIKVETDHRCIATFERHRGRHLLPDGGRGTETG